MFVVNNVLIIAASGRLMVVAYWNSYYRVATGVTGVYDHSSAEHTQDHKEWLGTKPRGLSGHVQFNIYTERGRL